METGEKYLNISISAGKILELAEVVKIALSKRTDNSEVKIYVSAWPKVKSSENSPLFAGDGLAVFENTKKAPFVTTESV